MVQSVRCFYCNRLCTFETGMAHEVPGTSLTKDHIFPRPIRAEIRKNTDRHLGLDVTVPACRMCNQARGPMPLGDFWMELQQLAKSVVEVRGES